MSSWVTPSRSSIATESPRAESLKFVCSGRDLVLRGIESTVGDEDASHVDRHRCRVVDFEPVGIFPRFDGVLEGHTVGRHHFVDLQLHCGTSLEAFDLPGHVDDPGREPVPQIRK